MDRNSRGFVNPFIVMDVMAKAKKAEEEGKDVIHMEVGKPSSSPPQKALELLANKITSSNLGYTQALGINSLKNSLSLMYKRNYNVNIDPERFIITSGSSSAFILAFISLFEAEDKILIGEPGYPSYKNIVKSLSLKSEIVQTQISNNFQISVEDIEKVNVNGLILASPCNPTGSILNFEKFKQLVKISKEKKIKIISDEIYHGWSYEKKLHSAIEFTDDAYVVGSFSKFFSMTGWRVGWMIVPINDVRRIERLSQNLFICAPHASQLLAKYSIDHQNDLQKNIETYTKNRKNLLKELPKFGFEILSNPDGAFYVYCGIEKISENSITLCEKIFNNTGVAITPGVDFDEKRGLRTVRFSYATTEENVISALKRFKLFFKK